MKKFLFFLIIIAIFSVISCTQTPEPELLHCKKYEQVDLPYNCQLINDMWGQEAHVVNPLDTSTWYAYAISGKYNTVTDFSQCTFNSSDENTINCGWIWRWTNPFGSSWVKAYPEILYGKNPFSGRVSTDVGNIPKIISDIVEIEVSYKADMQLKGVINSYNLCFDLWITDVQDPAQVNIKCEVMVWEAMTYVPGWGGLPVVLSDPVIVDGLSYQLYKTIHPLGFKYRAFLPNFQPDIANRVIRLDPFINFLKAEGDITDDQYLSNITFGNELSEGSGKTIIKNYKIKITSTGSITLYDDFTTKYLENNWVLSGTPKPRWVTSTFNKSGLLDNNGDGWHNSEAYSKTIIGSLSGYTIESEVYVNVANLSGCWVAPSIGITKSQNPAPVTTNNSDIPSGIRFTLTFEGGACWATPSQYRSHGWFSINIWAEDNTLNSPATWSLNGDNYLNGWHTLKIVVQSDRYVKFYCDNNLLWTSTKRLHPDIMTNKNVLLGDRSSNSAGKAYHNWVKVTEH